MLCVSTRLIHLQEYILNGTLKFVAGFLLWHLSTWTDTSVANGWKFRWPSEPVSGVRIRDNIFSRTWNQPRSLNTLVIAIPPRPVIPTMNVFEGHRVRILCLVGRASLYNLVNKSHWVHNSVWYIYLFLFCTCIGHPRAHHQEKIAVTMRPWYLSLCMGGVCAAGWVEIQPADQMPPIQSDKYQCCIDTAIFSRWWAHGCPKHVENNNK